MASSLESATSNARKFVIVFAVFAIGMILIQIFVTAGQDPTPTDPVPANTAYESADEALGKIPSPQVKSLTLAPGTQASYALDTKLPTFPPVVQVFAIEQPRERLGSVTQARNIANALKFAPTETQLSADVIQWQRLIPASTLQYNKVEQQWLIATDLTTAAKPLTIDTEILTDDNLPWIANAGFSKNNFTVFSGELYFIKATSAADYTAVSSPAQADLLRIAFYKTVEAAPLKSTYQPSLDDNPAEALKADVRSYNYTDGIINVILQKNGKIPEDLLALDYHEYQYGESGYYGVKSPEQAWNEIQNNQGYLYWLRQDNTDVFAAHEDLKVIEFRAELDKLKLIYIEPEDWLPDQAWTHFLQPYYLFEGQAITAEGQADFAFIIEALSASSYE